MLGLETYTHLPHQLDRIAIRSNLASGGFTSATDSTGNNPQILLSDFCYARTPTWKRLQLEAVLHTFGYALYITPYYIPLRMSRPVSQGTRILKTQACSCLTGWRGGTHIESRISITFPGIWVRSDGLTNWSDWFCLVMGRGVAISSCYVKLRIICPQVGNWVNILSTHFSVTDQYWSSIIIQSIYAFKTKLIIIIWAYLVSCHKRHFK